MRLAALLMTLLVVGCSVPRSTPEGGAVVGQIVNHKGKVLILGVADGQEQGQEPASGSGKGVVAALRKALMEHSIALSTSETTSIQDGIYEAEKLNFDYVLKCSITLWEDNATAWSGNGDKLSISVEVYDVKTKQLVAASSHRRVATGFALVSGSPDRFMDECAAGSLSKIYGWRAD